MYAVEKGSMSPQRMEPRFVADLKAVCSFVVPAPLLVLSPSWGSFHKHVFFPTPFFKPRFAIMKFMFHTVRTTYFLIISAPFSQWGQTIIYRV